MSTSRRLSNYLCEGLCGIAKWHRPRGWWLYPRLARYSALSDLRSEESLGFQSQVNLCVKVPDNTPSFCYRTMLVSENVYRFLHVQQPHSARLPDLHGHLPTRVSGSRIPDGEAEMFRVPFSLNFWTARSPLNRYLANHRLAARAQPPMTWRNPISRC